MKLLMLMVDQCEDVEAIATLDVLTRGGDEVVPVSLMNRKNIFPKYLPAIGLEKTIDDVDLKDFDGVILPGGPGSIDFMPNDIVTRKTIEYFVENKKLVAAICAAPHVIGRLGYLKDVKFTVHPGFEDKVIGGKYVDSGVVSDGNFITARSMYYSIDFALAIHEYFHGSDSRKALTKSIKAE